ncbi:MAG TPA: hypothetical protein PKZ36_00175 [Candidatus Paceibacterota bacterium]|nr:hypothetical protein [Candidatus Paceibacterota bacterium]HPT17820.1 hypothetical protein [Candidatus Paceibacterota bacterium]
MEKYYTNSSGQRLSLDEIIENKKIISVTIVYSLKRERKLFNIIKKILLTGEEKEQQKKRLTVNDTLHGINLFLTEEKKESASIRFCNKQEFEKVDDNYDRKTLSKIILMRNSSPFQINFVVNNLTSVDWQ